MGEKDWGSQADFFEGLNSYHKVIISFIDQISKENKFSNSKILDIGCGDGWISSFLNRKYNSKVTGIDVSPELISKSKQLHGSKNVQFFVSDAESFQSMERNFDFIFMNTLLCNISSQKKIENILKTSKSILKENGKIILINPHPCFEDKSVKNFRERFFKNKFNYFAKGQEYFIKLFKKDSSFLKAKNYHYSLSNYVKMFSKNNFSIVSLLEENFKENKEKSFSDYICFVLERKD